MEKEAKMAKEQEEARQRKVRCLCRRVRCSIIPGSKLSTTLLAAPTTPSRIHPLFIDSTNPRTHLPSFLHCLPIRPRSCGSAIRPSEKLGGPLQKPKQKRGRSSSCSGWRTRDQHHYRHLCPRTTPATTSLYPSKKELPQELKQWCARLPPQVDPPPPW